jgi:uncharacterized protein (TIGR00266 family)
MEYYIDHRPSYSLVIARLSTGEKIVAEAGAMVSMSASIDIETKARGGILGSLKRSVLGGESFFINTYTARSDGVITLAPSLPGDCEVIEMEGKGLMIQGTSYIASADTVEIDTKFAGMKGFISGEGFFFLKTAGTGPVFISSYGAIHEVNVTPDQDLVIDTGHIVAFEDNLTWNVKTVGGLKSTFFSGEGLVCRFSGEGKVWLQTRSPQAFLDWLVPKLPTKNK